MKSYAAKNVCICYINRVGLRRYDFYLIEQKQNDVFSRGCANFIKINMARSLF